MIKKNIAVSVRLIFNPDTGESFCKPGADIIKIYKKVYRQD